jgi:tetratricopeptide (TPR) repeat protein
VIIIGLLTGCSTEKNTLITRSYHNLTANYNIFFNGSESFKRGVNRAQEAYVDEYTQILPVFTYDDPSIAQSIAPEMETSISKATKVITLHSITAKPEYKNGPQTEKQKAFYARKEYNKWVDNNYLAMGKAYLYRQEFKLAIETYKFILTEYPNEDIVYETQIWLARAYNQTKEYKESDRILELLTSDERVPKKLYADLYATIADLRMKQEEYGDAIGPLSTALENVKKKKTRIRYAFILGQLNQETGNREAASSFYQQVIKMNPPYEMSFNARINRASVFVEGADKSREIKAELNKMLKDEKNTEYQDQIYFALANINMREGKTEEAISYYKLSSAKSISNPQQKTKSCLTLAELFYERQNYQSAKLYYDSAVVSLTPEYKDYADVMTKSRSLSSLIENLIVIQFEDSVQRLAGMSESERFVIIDSIIAKVSRDEQLAQMSEMQDMQDEQFNRMILSETSRSSDQSGESDGKWYFYNDAAKSFGQPEFKMKWGGRKLEDNWRRKNKTQISFGDMEAEATDSVSAEGVQRQVLSNKTREFYLQDVPLSDSMMVISNNKIIECMFNAGTVYKNDLKDKPKAIDTYKNLLERYPVTDFTLQTYYNLYLLSNELNDQSSSALYKSAIIREYPESQIAQLLTNPNFINELLEKENEVNRYYETTYNHYKQRDYYRVMNDADYALEKFKGNEMIPQFFFLKVLSIGQTSDIMTFTNALDSVTVLYPSHDVGQQAKEILAFIKNYNPEVKLETEKKEAEEIYKYDPSGAYFFGMIINRSIDINQLKFEIINFNLDLFPNFTFDVVSENLNDNYRLVLVKTFRDMQKAWEYYDTITTGVRIMELVEGTGYSRFVISLANSQTLLQDKTASKFLLFYDKYYKRNPENTVGPETIDTNS